MSQAQSPQGRAVHKGGIPEGGVHVGPPEEHLTTPDKWDTKVG